MYIWEACGIGGLTSCANVARDASCLSTNWSFVFPSWDGNPKLRLLKVPP